MSDDKRYFRSAKDGERGFLTERDGRQYIQLARPNEELLRNFVESEWVPEMERRPLSKAQLAFICFSADFALCKVLGLHGNTLKTWLDLSDKQRIAWMETGPKMTERHALWSAIMMVLEPLSR